MAGPFPKPCRDGCSTPKTQGDPGHPSTCICNEVMVQLLLTPQSSHSGPPTSETSWQVSIPMLSHGSRMQLPALLPRGQARNKGFLPRNRSSTVAQGFVASP